MSWGLRQWGDVARETRWIVPARPGGIARRVVDVQPSGDRLHLTDTEEPGPDMGFDISTHPLRRG